MELSVLSSIKLLDIEDNGFVGSIPDALGSLTELRTLFLTGNRLTGANSSSLFELPALRFFWLDDNAISGTIPESFTSSTSLSRFVADSNDLSGTIPFPSTFVKALCSRSSRLATTTSMERFPPSFLGRFFSTECGQQPIDGISPVQSHKAQNVG